MRELLGQLKLCMENLSSCVGMENSLDRYGEDTQGEELEGQLDRFEAEIQYYYLKNLSYLSEQKICGENFIEYLVQYRNIKEQLLAHI